MTAQMIDRYILDAEKAFARNDYLEGKELLVRALELEPNHNIAHNHLGWLYIFHLNDWEKAEMHLRFVLKIAPGYKSPYYHMTFLLLESGVFDELTKLLEKAKYVKGVHKSFIYESYGRMYEAEGHFKKAIENYKLAIMSCHNEMEINEYRNAIRRARQKRRVLMF